QPVPQREYRAVVRVRLLSTSRMVNRVKRGNGEEDRKSALEPRAPADVGVLELRRKRGRGAEQDCVPSVHQEDRARSRRHEVACGELAGVKARGARHVELRLGVVYAMEAPEPGNAVIREMPEPKDEIENEDLHGKRERTPRQAPNRLERAGENRDEPPVQE